MVPLPVIGTPIGQKIRAGNGPPNSDYYWPQKIVPYMSKIEGKDGAVHYGCCVAGFWVSQDDLARMSEFVTLSSGNVWSINRNQWEPVDAPAAM